MRPPIGGSACAAVALTHRSVHSFIWSVLARAVQDFEMFTDLQAQIMDVKPHLILSAIPAGALSPCVWRAGAAVVEGGVSEGRTHASRCRAMSPFRLPRPPEVPARRTPGHGVRLFTMCPGRWAPARDARMPVPGTTSPSPGAESPETARAAAPRSSAPVRPSPARPGTGRSSAAGTGR